MSLSSEAPRTALEAWMQDNSERDETLAPKVGVTRVQASRLRRGVNKPSLKTARKLEELTSIPALDLMAGEATPQ